MIFQFLQPSLYLRDFVREYLLFHFKVKSGTIVPVKPYHATAEEGIIFYVRGSLMCTQIENGVTEKRAETVIFGPSVSRQILHLPDEYLMFFVRLQPGILHQLFRISMNELVQKNIDAEVFFGKQVRELHEKLVNAPSYEVILNLIEDFLLKKFQQLSANLHPSSQIPKLILKDPSSFNLDKMASQACLSPRQFERIFLRQVGVTPKLFSRLCRFNQASELKERYPNRDWLRIAMETGYNDYQHLVKDFKSFDGGTPNTLVAENKPLSTWLNLASPGKTQ